MCISKSKIYSWIKIVLKIDFLKINFLKIDFLKIDFSKIDFLKINFLKIDFSKIDLPKHQKDEQIETANYFWPEWMLLKCWIYMCLQLLHTNNCELNVNL